MFLFYGLRVSLMGILGDQTEKKRKKKSDYRLSRNKRKKHTSIVD